MSATTVSTCPGDRRRQARAALGRLELTINRSDREVALIAEEVNKLSRSYDAEWAARLVQRLAGIQAELAAAARAVGVEPHLLLAVQARGSAAQRVARVLDDLAFEQLRLSAVMLGLEMPRRSDPTPRAPRSAREVAEGDRRAAQLSVLSSLRPLPSQSSPPSPPIGCHPSSAASMIPSYSAALWPSRSCTTDARP